MVYRILKEVPLREDRSGWIHWSDGGHVKVSEWNHWSFYVWYGKSVDFEVTESNHFWNIYRFVLCPYTFHIWCMIEVQRIGSVQLADGQFSFLLLRQDKEQVEPQSSVIRRLFTKEPNCKTTLLLSYASIISLVTSKRKVCLNNIQRCHRYHESCILALFHYV